MSQVCNGPLEIPSSSQSSSSEADHDMKDRGVELLHGPGRSRSCSSTSSVDGYIHSLEGNCEVADFHSHHTALFSEEEGEVVEEGARVGVPESALGDSLSNPPEIDLVHSLNTDSEAPRREVGKADGASVAVDDSETERGVEQANYIDLNLHYAPPVGSQIVRKSPHPEVVIPPPHSPLPRPSPALQLYWSPMSPTQSGESPVLTPSCPLSPVIDLTYIPPPNGVTTPTESHASAPAPHTPEHDRDTVHSPLRHAPLYSSDTESSVSSPAENSSLGAQLYAVPMMPPPTQALSPHNTECEDETAATEASTGTLTAPLPGHLLSQRTITAPTVGRASGLYCPIMEIPQRVGGEGGGLCTIETTNGGGKSCDLGGRGERTVYKGVIELLDDSDDSDSSAVAPTAAFPNPVLAAVGEAGGEMGHGKVSVTRPSLLAPPGGVESSGGRGYGGGEGADGMGALTREVTVVGGENGAGQMRAEGGGTDRDSEEYSSVEVDLKIRRRAEGSIEAEVNETVKRAGCVEEHGDKEGIGKGVTLEGTCAGPLSSAHCSDRGDGVESSVTGTELCSHPQWRGVGAVTEGLVGLVDTPMAMSCALDPSNTNAEVLGSEDVIGAGVSVWGEGSRADLDTSMTVASWGKELLDILDYSNKLLDKQQARPQHQPALPMDRGAEDATLISRSVLAMDPPKPPTAASPPGASLLVPISDEKRMGLKRKQPWNAQNRALDVNIPCPAPQHLRGYEEEEKALEDERSRRTLATTMNVEAVPPVQYLNGYIPSTTSKGDVGVQRSSLPSKCSISAKRSSNNYCSTSAHYRVYFTALVTVDKLLLKQCADAGLIYAYERLPDDLEGKDQGVDSIIHVLVTSAVGSRMIGREKGHGSTVRIGREARRGVGGAERLTFARRTITYMRALCLGIWIVDARPWLSATLLAGRVVDPQPFE
eukprot:gene3121-3849_t